jgi:hypothetical protein
MGLAYIHSSFMAQKSRRTATGRRTGKPALGWDVRQGIKQERSFVTRRNAQEENWLQGARQEAELTRTRTASDE